MINVAAMLTRKGKIIVFGLLILVGVVLLAYGVFFHSENILPQQNEDSAMLVQSEPALIKEVSVGGIKRDESGRLKRTYDKTPPKACPT